VRHVTAFHHGIEMRACLPLKFLDFFMSVVKQESSKSIALDVKGDRCLRGGNGVRQFQCGAVLAGEVDRDEGFEPQIGPARRHQHHAFHDRQRPAKCNWKDAALCG
jgi:hypothetical protein